MTIDQAALQPRTPHRDGEHTVTSRARSDRSRDPGRSRSFGALSQSTGPTTASTIEERKGDRFAVEVIAARVLTVAAVAMIVMALYGLTLFGRSDGFTAVVVSGAFGVSAAVVVLIVGFINARRATGRGL
jgi:hypothetical protein